MTKDHMHLADLPKYYELLYLITTLDSVSVSISYSKVKNIYCDTDKHAKRRL